jgi:DNA-directed RNA polymerase specialized sigma24 family protein
MDGMRLSVLVKREQALDTGTWVWTALPQGFPGSTGGRTIPELQDEVEALKHFFTGEDQGTDIAVDYIYELPGVAPEILIDYRHERSERDRVASELRRANDELSAKARAAATALRAAGLSIRDSAALMGLSKSRFEQISS